eukprot:COSAG01_NODE_771_length_13718_cov_54.441442_7_plen_134_part_00
MWVLRALGDEILDATPHEDDADPSHLGFAWLQEHLGVGYESCYATPLIPAPWHPDPDGMDASLCDVDTGQEQRTLRWSNYYVRSLQFIMTNPPYVDGLYLVRFSFLGQIWLSQAISATPAPRARTAWRLIATQ